MIENALQILMFVLITASYFFIIKTLFNYPIFIYGLFLIEWYKKQHYTPTPQEWSMLVRYENISILILDIAFILSFFWFRLWDSSWLKLWESPFVAALVFFILLQQASLLESYIPILRVGASFALWASLLIIILLGIGQFAPKYFIPTVFQWAVASSGFLLLFAMALSILKLPRDFQSFATLNDRRNSIGESLQRLQRIANLIGDKAIREALDQVNKCYSQAFEELKGNRLKEADAFIIQAEMEINQIERTFKDRMSLSLPDELKVRLKQAATDVNSLKEEFEKNGLSAGNLDQLSNEIEVQISTLDELDMSDKNLFKRLDYIEGLFHEIVDTRTALRFRQNVSSTIDLFYKDVEKNWLLVQIAKNIGLDATEAEKRKQAIDSALHMFQYKPINSSRELIQAYQLIQSELTSFQASVAILTSTINRNYNVEVIDSGQISIYIPKFCSTNQSVRGAVIVQYKEPHVENVSFDLDGTLLELQSERNVIVSPIQGQTYGLSHFTFVGKRGGVATLTLHFKNVNHVNYHSYNVQVNPSLGEIGQNALLFGTPSAGFAVLILWSIGIDLKEAGTIGVAIGGAIVLVIFIINYMRYHRGS